MLSVTLCVFLRFDLCGRQTYPCAIVANSHVPKWQVVVWHYWCVSPPALPVCVPIDTVIWYQLSCQVIRFVPLTPPLLCCWFLFNRPEFPKLLWFRRGPQTENFSEWNCWSWTSDRPNALPIAYPTVAELGVCGWQKMTLVRFSIPFRKKNVFGSVSVLQN